MKVGLNVAWRLVSGNLLTVTSILGLRALLWRLLTKASLGASLSLGRLLRVKEARESGLSGDQMRRTGLPGGPTQTARAYTHRPAFTFVPPSYATVRAHGMGGARQAASVPSWGAPRGPGCTARCAGG